MKIGIAAATSFEIQPSIDYLQAQQFIAGPHEVNIIITGIGSMLTAYELTKYTLQNQPDYLIQAGIAGSFSRDLLPGDVALIKQDLQGDLGVEEKEGFRDVFELGFMQASQFPFKDRYLPNPSLLNKKSLNYRLANGITVNEISTDPLRIQLLRDKYQCEIESMEGAAFHYVCLRENIPFIQLRAVSNQVGERDKSKWAMQPAIEKLNSTLKDLLQNLP